MKKPVLKIDNLSKSFGAVKANDNLNLNLFKNEIHALIGPNGSGKSTLVKQISGFLKQDSGQIYLCLLYTSPSPRDISGSRMPSSA